MIDAADWWNLLALLLLSAGNAAVAIAALNRLQSLPLSRSTLRRGRHLHFLVMAGFPPLALWRIGLGETGLLHAGNWSDLPWGWVSYLTLCLLGLVGLGYSVIRYQSYRPPRFVAAQEVTHHDVARDLGQQPIGIGPHCWMATLPFNQVWQLDVTVTSVQLPRLPEAWRGLSILHLSDLHFIGTVDRPYFERVCEIAAAQAADLIVFTGDLLDNQELVNWLPQTLGRLAAPLGCYSILGNHDCRLDPGAIRRHLSELGWIDVAGRTVLMDHQGATLAIGGTELPWMGTHPEFESASDQFRLLLSHTPDNLPWARSQLVDLMLAGHNHGGQIRLPVLGPVYSPSISGCRFSSGTFWTDPTFLQVTRGVGGKEPIRINCRPEIIKLVLQPEPR